MSLLGEIYSESQKKDVPKPIVPSARDIIERQLEEKYNAGMAEAKRILCEELKGLADFYNSHGMNKHVANRTTHKSALKIGMFEHFKEVYTIVPKSTYLSTNGIFFYGRTSPYNQLIELYERISVEKAVDTLISNTYGHKNFKIGWLGMNKPRTLTIAGKEVYEVRYNYASERIYYHETEGYYVYEFDVFDQELNPTSYCGYLLVEGDSTGYAKSILKQLMNNMVK